MSGGEKVTIEVVVFGFEGRRYVELETLLTLLQEARPNDRELLDVLETCRIADLTELGFPRRKEPS